MYQFICSPVEGGYIVDNESLVVKRLRAIGALDGLLDNAVGYDVTYESIVAPLLRDMTNLNVLLSNGEYKIYKSFYSDSFCYYINGATIVVYHNGYRHEVVYLGDGNFLFNEILKETNYELSMIRCLGILGNNIVAITFKDIVFSISGEYLEFSGDVVRGRKVSSDSIRREMLCCM